MVRRSLWAQAKDGGGGRRAEAAFCEQNFLSSVTLRTIADLRCAPPGATPLAES
jgi:hypothetical protein